MLGSNQRPLPCEVSSSFLVFSKTSKLGRTRACGLVLRGPFPSETRGETEGLGVTPVAGRLRSKHPQETGVPEAYRNWLSRRFVFDPEYSLEAEVYVSAIVSEGGLLPELKLKL